MSRRPSMRRTGVRDLAAPFVVIGVIVYVLLRAGYGSLPPIGYFASVPLAALAVVEFVIARRVLAAVRHDPRARPMTALAIARAVALGKASALVGAAVLGASCALLAWVLPDASTVNAAAHDSRAGVALAVASVLLMVAGLMLERSGIDPGHGDREREQAERA